MVPPWIWERIVRSGLEEDLGAGDITTTAIIPRDSTGTLRFKARQPLVVAGMEAIRETYRQFDQPVDVEVLQEDGAVVTAGTILAIARGPSRVLLSGERVSLNIVQRLAGIATVTHNAVELLTGLDTILLDTRKTTPGWRAVERWATRVGGARNHRFDLNSAVLIKDNHIAAVGGITSAIEAVRKIVGPTVFVEVEVDRLDQIGEALDAKPDGILFDNMDVDTLRKAVRLVDGRAFTEASGGIHPSQVRQVAETGVNAISLGWLTHSAQAIDIGADWESTDGH